MPWRQLPHLSPVPTFNPLGRLVCPISSGSLLLYCVPLPCCHPVLVTSSFHLDSSVPTGCLLTPCPPAVFYPLSLQNCPPKHKTGHDSSVLQSFPVVLCWKTHSLSRTSEPSAIHLSLALSSATLASSSQFLNIPCSLLSQSLGTFSGLFLEHSLPLFFSWPS